MLLWRVKPLISLRHLAVCFFFCFFFLAGEKANIQSISNSLCNIRNLDRAGKFILIIAQNDLPKQTANTNY